MRRLTVCTILAVVVAAVAIGVLAPAAAANPPVKSEFTFADTGVAEDGNITSATATGVIARAPLPDGRLFISAGRVDLAARGFPQFILTPDVGAAVNLSRFCTALAP